MSKNSLLHLATRILNTPLMIMQAKLDAILCGPDRLGERFGLEILPDKIQASDLKPTAIKSGVRSVSEDVTVAIIPIHGILVQRSGQVDAQSARLRSYQAIGSDFQEALQDPRIDKIVFDIDSPGGEVSGVFDLVDKIFHARVQKPIHAIVNEGASSAAYALASAAEKIFIPRTGNVGSIGVIAIHCDQSSFDEKIGASYTHIFAGARKADFSPHAPLSDAARNLAQADINNIYDIFLETVARNRGSSVESVRKTEAGSFTGKSAVDIGLADEVMSFDEAILEIAQNKNGGGQSMETLKDKMEKAMVGYSGQDNSVALAELGYVPQTSQDSAVNVDSIKADAKKEHQSYVAGVMKLCTLAKMPEQALGFIEAETSIVAVGEKLITAKAEASERTEIISTVNPMNNGETNLLLASAEKRSQAGQHKNHV